REREHRNEADDVDQNGSYVDAVQLRRNRDDRHCAHEPKTDPDRVHDAICDDFSAVVLPADLARTPVGWRRLHTLEPIRKDWIQDEAFGASRLSMMRIMARRMKAATVVA